jgi:hypothetical protein
MAAKKTPAKTKKTVVKTAAPKARMPKVEAVQVEQIDTTRDSFGRKLILEDIPQFLRDAALAKPPLSIEEIRREFTRDRAWVMPNRNAPRRESMASVMSKYEVEDFDAPVNVQVALSDKVGSILIATYDNWDAFKAGHNVTEYPIKKTATFEGKTIVIVRATPFAGRVKGPAKVREGKSKKEIVGDLLMRAEGCTTKDILEATGWPAVSVPAQAKVVGLKLRKEKVDEVTRYWGSK